MNENIFVPDNPNDLELVISLTKKLSAERGLAYQELGMIDSCPIMLLTPKTTVMQKKYWRRRAFTAMNMPVSGGLSIICSTIRNCKMFLYCHSSAPLPLKKTGATAK